MSSHIQVLARKKVREYQTGIKVRLGSHLVAPLWLPPCSLAFFFFSFPSFPFPSWLLSCRCLAICRFLRGESLVRFSLSWRYALHCRAPAALTRALSFPSKAKPQKLIVFYTVILKCCSCKHLNKCTLVKSAACLQFNAAILWLTAFYCTLHSD